MSEKRRVGAWTQGPRREVARSGAVFSAAPEEGAGPSVATERTGAEL